MARVVVGLGSNVGDRLAHLRAAVERIHQSAAARVRLSSIYETKPVGGPPQDDFLNMAMVFDWPSDGAELHDLLERLQVIERELGRVRDERWGPRTIDIDILWVEDVVIATPRLTVPHPRLVERAFALLPLVEIAPDACDPRSGARLADSVDALRGQDARRLEIALEPDA